MFSLPLSHAVDLLALHQHDRQRFPYLLMSSGDSGWDILFALPQSLTVYGSRDAAVFAADLAALSPDVGACGERTLPFTGGWFVYLGYETAQAFEPTVPAAADDAFPLAAIARVPAAVLYDRSTGQGWLVAEQDAQLDVLAQAVAQTPAWTPATVAVRALEEEAPERYLDAVQRIKRYIADGDVFQVNISRGWRARLDAAASAADLFAALRRVNPAPFSALADFGCAQIISASPERLVRVREGVADTRPIAGTHPRSSDPQADAALRQRLISSVKERAEHVMLIDLERNDLGRLCRPGSVAVDELMAVASYAYVHHIESNVRGRLRAGLNAADVLRAMFPGGTITGCPKVRTMQIIRELEAAPRRAYTGSLGYINHDGAMDFNILIRSFMREGEWLRFRAGGGIVADSDPGRELMETRHKARGLLRALGVEEA